MTLYLDTSSLVKLYVVEPGSEMVDHLGRTVVSSLRGECHFGLTPGGCTDHSSRRCNRSSQAHRGSCRGCPNRGPEAH